jgi:threonine/homoserine/homoserine lactone efflux protein
MNWPLWWIYATACFFLDLTPGPAVLLVLGSSLSVGARKALASIAGILIANLLYFALSATSVGALLASSTNIFLVAKWVGASYLFYLGARAMLSSGSLLLDKGSGRKTGSAAERFGIAFLTQASNPKAIVFFAAFVPQFIDAKLPIVRQMVILAVSSTVIEFFVLGGYAFAASRASALTRQPRFAVWTNRAAGALLMTAAVGIALMRR